MNQAENEAGNKAVDSLINYETVKVRKIQYNFHICELFKKKFENIKNPV